MRSLFIEKTANSPEVDFNTSNNIFKIEGNSRPENPSEFYEQITGWLENYGKELSWKNRDFAKDKIIFNIRLYYFNSTSAKHLLLILDQLNNFATDMGVQVDVSWYYDEQDDMMRENGEEYKKIIPNVKFHFIVNVPDK